MKEGNTDSHNNNINNNDNSNNNNNYINCDNNKYSGSTHLNAAGVPR